MKIKGVEGLSAELIANEVDRGAKFVLYNYCISIFILTFKRSSDVYFIKPGQGRFVPGLPFSLISFVLGWWGIPWGPIYTIECLVRNFGGGTDVTNAIMESVYPDRRAAAAPPLPLTGSAPAPRSGSSSSFTGQQVLVGCSVLAALIVGIYAVVCFQFGQRMDAVLLSGMSEAYSVEVNGTTYQLPPYGLVRLKLPEGDVKVSGLAGQAPQTAHLETSFWGRPFDPQVAVINPDRLGLFLKYPVTYYSGSDRNRPTQTDESYTLYANQLAYLLPEPDYFFVEEPKTISMSSTVSTVTKTRFAELPLKLPAKRALAVQNKLGAAASTQYVIQLAQLRPSDEQVLAVIPGILKKEEAVALFESRLAERPVLVDWHRAYQGVCQHWKKDDGLADKYARMAAAEPTNGTLVYLLARLERDPVRARELFERALKAPQPGIHGHLGLAHLELGEAHFESALAHYQSFESAGLALEVARLGKREALLGLERYNDIFTDAKKHREANPRDLSAAIEEIQAVALKKPSKEAIEAVLKENLGRLNGFGSSTPEEKAETRAYLEANAAYALGQEHVFASKLRGVKEPYAQFQAAVAERNFARAEQAIKNETEPSCFVQLTLYLTAVAAGDTSGAEQYWKGAEKAMGQELTEYEAVARHLSGAQVLTPEQICALPIMTYEKRVLLTALGARDPVHRAVYHSFAARINHSPAFPHLLLEAAIKAPSLSGVANSSSKPPSPVF